MRIMLTNDDGICAPGMEALVQELHKDHTLLVSAPDRQRSATSRCLTCYGTLYAQPHIYDFAPEVEAYAVSGTPADSARLGESNLFRDIDILLSGINDGGESGHGRAVFRYLRRRAGGSAAGDERFGAVPAVG